MSGILSSLFRRKEIPPFDVEKAVGHYLLTLPRCTSRVEVVSRRFLDKRYDYEMTAATSSLAEWAKMYESNGWGNQTEQAICKALLLWLRGADLLDPTISLPPKEFFDVWRCYHSTFYEMPGTKVYCHKCAQIIAEVSMKDTELPPIEIFDRMHYEWFCPEGHLLYQEEIGRHGSKISHAKFRELFDEDGDPLDIPNFLRKKI
jgi:hypothetical protein